MDNTVPEHAFPNSLEAISKHFALFQPLKRIRGPLTLREALGVSQAEVGKLLAHYTGGREYVRSTVSLWERVERGVRLPAKYAMNDRAREAYRLLMRDVVELAGEGRYQIRATMGARRWRFELLATCSNCEKWFAVKRAGQVRCARCIANGRRK